jgi:hypothetical protein
MLISLENNLGTDNNWSMSIMNGKLIKISEELYKQDLFTAYSDFLTEDLFRFEFIKKIFLHNCLEIEKPYIKKYKKGDNGGLLDSSLCTELDSKSRSRLDLYYFKSDDQQYAFEFKYNKECSIDNGCPTTLYGSCLNDIRRLALLSKNGFICYFVYLHKKGKHRSRAPIQAKLLSCQDTAIIFRIKDLIDSKQKEYWTKSHTSFQGISESDKEKNACKNDEKQCEIIFCQDFSESYHLAIIKF